MHIHTCFEFIPNQPDLHRHILGRLATRDILSGRIDKFTQFGKNRKYSQEYVFKRLGNSWINQPLSYMLECSRLYVHAYMDSYLWNLGVNVQACMNICAHNWPQVEAKSHMSLQVIIMDHLHIFTVFHSKIGHSLYWHVMKI